MIDSRAIIDPGAKIASDVVIGPYTIIGNEVEIGAGTKIEAHTVINGPTKIGRNNHISSFASVGNEPQSKQFKNERTSLEIGDNNIIREYVTISRGTKEGGGITRIGNNNFFMTYCHIAHDCQVGNYVLFINNAAVAGHVVIEDHVTLGAFSAVHQFCRVGQYSFLAHAAMIGKDVLPYIVVAGNDAKVVTLNAEGLRRRGFDADVIQHLREGFRIIYKRGLKVNEAVQELEKMVPHCVHLQAFVDGLNLSTRGIQR